MCDSGKKVITVNTHILSTRSLSELKRLPSYNYLLWQTVGQCWCPGKEISIGTFTDAKDKNYCMSEVVEPELLEREPECPEFTLPADR